MCILHICTFTSRVSSHFLVFKLLLVNICFISSVLQNVVQDSSIGLFCARAVTFLKRSQLRNVQRRASLLLASAVVWAAALLPAGWQETGASALLSAALDSRCALSSASPILDRHLLTAQKLFGLHPCSSVTANVIAPLSPVLKSAKMWTKWHIAHWCWSSSSAAAHTSDRCVVRPAKDTDPQRARQSCHFIMETRPSTRATQRKRMDVLTKALPCGKCNHWSAPADRISILF